MESPKGSSLQSNFNVTPKNGSKSPATAEKLIKARVRLFRRPHSFKGFSVEDCRKSSYDAVRSKHSITQKEKEEKELEQDYFITDGLTCIECLLTFSSGDHLNIHKTFCGKSSSYAPGRLDLGNEHEDLLREKASGMLSCPWCPLLSCDMSALQKHLSCCQDARRRRDEREILKLLPCPECSKEYTELEHLLIHLQSHYVGDVECGPCKKSFDSVSSLSKHLISCTSKEFYRCSDCSKQCPNALSFRAHLLSCKSLTQCLKCAKVVIERAYCRDHMIMHLTTEWAQNGLKMINGVLRLVPECDEESKDSDGKVLTVPPRQDLPQMNTEERTQRISPNCTKNSIRMSPLKKNQTPSKSSPRKQNVSNKSGLEYLPEDSHNASSSDESNATDSIRLSSRASMACSETSVRLSVAQSTSEHTTPIDLRSRYLRDNRSMTDNASIPNNVWEDKFTGFEAPSCDDIPLAEEDNFSVIDNEVYEIENDLGEIEIGNEGEFPCSQTFVEESDYAVKMGCIEECVGEIENDSQETPQLFIPALNDAENEENGGELTLTVVNVEGGTNLFSWDECENLNEGDENQGNKKYFGKDDSNTSIQEEANITECAIEEDAIDRNAVEVVNSEFFDSSIPQVIKTNGNIDTGSRSDANEDVDSGIDATEDRDSNKDLAEDIDVANEVIVRSSTCTAEITPDLSIKEEIALKSKFPPLFEHTYALKVGQLSRQSKNRLSQRKPKSEAVCLKAGLDLTSGSDSQVSPIESNVNSKTMQRKRPKKNREVVPTRAQKEYLSSSEFSSSRVLCIDSDLNKKLSLDCSDSKEMSNTSKVPLTNSDNQESGHSETLSSALCEVSDCINLILPSSDVEQTSSQGTKSAFSSASSSQSTPLPGDIGTAVLLPLQQNNVTHSEAPRETSDGVKVSTGNGKQLMTLDGNSKRLLLHKTMLPLLKNKGSSSNRTTVPIVKGLQSLPSSQKLQVVGLVPVSKIEDRSSAQTVSSIPNSNQSIFSSLNVVDFRKQSVSKFSNSPPPLAICNSQTLVNKTVSNSNQQKKCVNLNEAKVVDHPVTLRVVNLSANRPSQQNSKKHYSRSSSVTAQVQSSVGKEAAPQDQFSIQGWCSNSKPELKSSHCVLLTPCSKDIGTTKSENREKRVDKILNRDDLIESSSQSSNTQTSKKKEKMNEISRDEALKMQRREKSMLSRGFKPMATISPLQGCAMKTSIVETSPMHISNSMSRNSNSMHLEHPERTSGENPMNVTSSRREQSMLSHGFQQMATVFPQVVNLSKKNEKLVTKKMEAFKESLKDTPIDVSLATRGKIMPPHGSQQTGCLPPNKIDPYSNQNVLGVNGNLLPASVNEVSADIPKREQTLLTNQFQHNVSSPARKENLFKPHSKKLLTEIVKPLRNAVRDQSSKTNENVSPSFHQTDLELTAKENFFHTVMHKIISDRVNSSQASSDLVNDSITPRKEEIVPSLPGMDGRLFSAVVTKLVCNRLQTVLNNSHDTLENPTKKDSSSSLNVSHAIPPVLPPKKKFLRESYKYSADCEESSSKETLNGADTKPETNPDCGKRTSPSNALMLIVSSDGDVLPHPKFSAPGRNSNEDEPITNPLSSDIKVFGFGKEHNAVDLSPQSNDIMSFGLLEDQSTVDFSKDRDKSTVPQECDISSEVLGKNIKSINVHQKKERKSISSCLLNLSTNIAALGDSSDVDLKSDTVQEIPVLPAKAHIESKWKQQDNLSQTEELKQKRKEGSRLNLIRALQSSVPNLEKYNVVLMSSDEDSEEEICNESSVENISSVFQSTAKETVASLKLNTAIVTQDDTDEGANTISSENIQPGNNIGESASCNIFNLSHTSAIEKNSQPFNLLKLNSKVDFNTVCHHSSSDLHRGSVDINLCSNPSLPDRGGTKMEKTSLSGNLHLHSILQESKLDDTVIKIHTIDNFKLKASESSNLDEKKSTEDSERGLKPNNLKDSTINVSTTSSDLHGNRSCTNEFSPVNSSEWGQEVCGLFTDIGVSDSEVPVEKCSSLIYREKKKTGCCAPSCKHPSRMLMTQMACLKRSKFGRQGLYKKRSSVIFRCSNCVSWFYSQKDLDLHKCLRAMINEKFASQYLDRFYCSPPLCATASSDGIAPETSSNMKHVLAKTDNDECTSNTSTGRCGVINSHLSNLPSLKYPYCGLVARKAGLKRKRYGREGLFKKNSSGAFSCSTCQSRFNSQTDLGFHECLKAIIMEKFTSDSCNRFFDYNKSNEVGPKSRPADVNMSPYESFLREKAIGKTRRFFCDKCQMKCKSFSALLEHKSIMHSEKTSLQCHICSKEFDRLQKLAVHYAKSHKSNDGISGKVFHPIMAECSTQLESTEVVDSVKTKTLMVESVVSTSENSEEVKSIKIQEVKSDSTMCETGEEMNYQDGFRIIPPNAEESLKPENESPREEPASCRLDSTEFENDLNRCHQCNKSFKSKGGLKSHINQTHLVSIRCPVCSRKFTYQQRMEAHFKANHVMEITSESKEVSTVLTESATCDVEHAVNTSIVKESAVAGVQIQNSHGFKEKSEVETSALCCEDFGISSLSGNEVTQRNHYHPKTSSPKKNHKKAKWRIVTERLVDSNTVSKPVSKLDTSQTSSSEEEMTSIGSFGPDSARPLILSLSKVKKHQYKCTECVESFRKQHLLVLHRAKKHGTPGKFICFMCSLELKDFYQLAAHGKSCKQNIQSENVTGSHGTLMMSSKNEQCSVCAQDVTPFPTACPHLSQFENAEDRINNRGLKLLEDIASVETQVSSERTEVDSQKSVEDDLLEETTSTQVCCEKSEIDSQNSMEGNLLPETTSAQVCCEKTEIDSQNSTQGDLLSETTSAQVCCEKTEVDSQNSTKGDLSPETTSVHNLESCISNSKELKKQERRKTRYQAFSESLRIGGASKPIVSQNQSKQIWKCEECLKGFKSRGFLQRHKIDYHGVPCLYKCTVCGMKFTELQTLQQHQKVRHKMKKLLINQDGDVDNSSISVPNAVQLGGPSSAEQSSSDLPSHSNKSKKCEGCNKVFKRYMSLKQHKRRHHKKKEARPLHPCELKSKSAKLLSALESEVHSSKNENDSVLDDPPTKLDKSSHQYCDDKAIAGEYGNNLLQSSSLLSNLSSIEADLCTDKTSQSETTPGHISVSNSLPVLHEDPQRNSFAEEKSDKNKSQVPVSHTFLEDNFQNEFETIPLTDSFYTLHNPNIAQPVTLQSPPMCSDMVRNDVSLTDLISIPSSSTSSGTGTEGMTSFHERKDFSQCSVCGSSFSSWYALQEHFNYNHTLPSYAHAPFPHVLPIGYSSYNNHQISYSSCPTIADAYCISPNVVPAKWTSSYQELTYHSVAHCSICGLCFPSPLALQEHHATTHTVV